MLVEEMRDQWIYSCGNWVDGAFSWCPDCCEERSTLILKAEQQGESNILHTS